LLGALAAGWQTPNGAGHWEGVIKGANRDVAITVDLLPNPRGGWTGAMGIPDQGAKDIPLSGIAIQADSVRFRMFDSPDSPVFDGRISGENISGSVSGGGESTAFQLKRTGAAILQPPRPSTRLSKEFEGTWEGLLGAGDRQLHLILKLAASADGTGAGSLSTAGGTSPDIPITTITQKENRLDFEVRAISGSYSGTLNQGRGEISGNWTQGGATVALVFQRAAGTKK
jgi:hypothetical protein